MASALSHASSALQAARIEQAKRALARLGTATAAEAEAEQQRDAELERIKRELDAAYAARQVQAQVQRAAQELRDVRSRILGR